MECGEFEIVSVFMKREVQLTLQFLTKVSFWTLIQTNHCDSYHVWFGDYIVKGKDGKKQTFQHKYGIVKTNCLTPFSETDKPNLLHKRKRKKTLHCKNKRYWSFVFSLNSINYGLLQEESSILALDKETLPLSSNNWGLS